MEARVIDAYAKAGSCPEEDELILTNYLEGRRISLAVCGAPSLKRGLIEHIAAKHMLALPLKLAVGSKKDVRSSDIAKAHAIESLRNVDEFIFINSSLAVASPALCTVAGTNCKDDIGTAISIARACSSYAISQGKIFVQTNSLVNKAGLAECANKLQHSPSLVLRSHAASTMTMLPFVTENLCSPRELALQLLLCLPKRLGGFGLTVPTANKAMNLNSVQSSICGRKYLVPDLFWEKAALDVEYNGYEYHSYQDQIESDKTRRAALKLAGIEVIEVDDAIISSVGETRKVANRIAQRNNLKLETRGPSFGEKHMALRSRLLHPSSAETA